MKESDNVLEFLSLSGKRGKQEVPIQTAYAICKSIDWEAKTMVAIGQTDDLEYYDISLGNGFEYKKPKVNTLCLIGLIENQPANAFLIDANEIEEYLITVQDSVIQVKPEGIKMTRSGEVLKTVLNDLINKINKLNEQLQAVIVIQGTSPNIPALQQLVSDKETIKQRLNTILID